MCEGRTGITNKNTHVYICPRSLRTCMTWITGDWWVQRGGNITEVSPAWRSSLLCQQSGRCWGSFGWRARRWIVLPADPQLLRDHTVNAATYNSTAVEGWRHREEWYLYKGSTNTVKYIYFDLWGEEQLPRKMYLNVKFIFLFTLWLHTMNH